MGLYAFRPAGFAANVRGISYLRNSPNGKQTSRSLETSVFEHSTIQHAKLRVDVEKDRQRRANVATDLKTLCALYCEMDARFALNSVAHNMEVGGKNAVARL